MADDEQREPTPDEPPRVPDDAGEPEAGDDAPSSAAEDAEAPAGGESAPDEAGPPPREAEDEPTAAADEAGPPSQDAEAAGGEPTAAADEADSPAAGEPQPAAQEGEPEAPAGAAPEGEPATQAADGERERPPRRRRDEQQAASEEVVPGAHLEPDLVLEEQQGEEGDFDRYAAEGAVEEEPALAEGEGTEERPLARTPMELAADARYRATGKRKTAVARVILRPGGGSYVVNGRTLDEFFPRETLRLTARQPLEAAGYGGQMDVIVRVHGGGISAQAGAVRHGVARALVEADPNLRGELKRRGFLTRDARVKERKKAGLKKARKRPQFSKR